MLNLFDLAEPVSAPARARLKRRPGILLLLGALSVSVSVFGCEPDAFLGRDTQNSEGLTMGGASSNLGGAQSQDFPDDETLVLEEPGAAGAPGALTVIQGHECSSVEAGESHDELTAVCCEMTEPEEAWRQQVVAEINQVRVDAGLEPFERHPGLDQAAMAWTMHWFLHWDPVAKTGRPDDYTAPSKVAAACGTTAKVMVLTNAQGEDRLESGLIDPSIPASKWKTSRTFTEDFHDPYYTRIGVGFYEGLLVGLFGGEEAL